MSNIVSTPKTNQDIGLGARGNIVYEIQNVLREVGVLSSDSDGVYGKETKNAVEALQQVLGVTPSGIWDEKTSGSLGTILSTTGIAGVKGSVMEKFPVVAGGFGGFSKSIGGLPGLGNNKIPVSPGIIDVTGVSVLGGAKSPIGSVMSGGLVGNQVSNKKRASIPRDAITCFITNLNTGTTLEFPAVPSEVTETVAANYEQTSTKGRSSAFYSYSDSGPHTISFNLTTCDDYIDIGIVNLVRRLQAQCYPHKETVVLSPKSYFQLGDFIKLYVVLMSVDITWRSPYREGIFTMCDMNLMMHHIEDRGHYDNEVEGNV